jgi:mycothiol synthase
MVGPAGTLDGVLEIEVIDQGGEDGRAPSVALVARTAPGGDIVGRAKLGTDPSGWALDYDIEPAYALPGSKVADELVAEAAAVVAARGGGMLTLWVTRPTPAHEQVAATAGLAPGRVLYEMRRSLPVDETHRRGAEPLATRAFRPGQDEEAWLAVNNRAFAWHPEQGGWTLDTIAQHEAEPWFDPEGFRIHETDGRLDGFCWTQVHAEEDPALGEIYVIAADPDAAGGGFGRRLVLAGLDHLAGLGITVGMLYTDATNERAVKLYVDLGFVVHHLTQGFTGAVPAGALSARKEV